MSWEDQGRQYHMWFGHGTASGGSDANRASELAYGAIGALSRAQRRTAEGQLRAGTLDRLTMALPIWMRAAQLDAATFAERFFGRAADDPAVANIHAAVIAASLAPGHAEMRGASQELAGAMKAVGLSRWPRFVAEGQTRAQLLAELDLTNVTPVPFRDDHGTIVLDRSGKPMLRPAGMDPHFFVEQGLKDREKEDAMLASGGEGGAAGALGHETGALSNFNRGRAWDAQRIGGSYHPEFVNYATVAIGLYAAANGIPKSEILTIQNIVARTSHYAPDTEKDNLYNNLPIINVWNTDIGYYLYESGRIFLDFHSH